MGTKGNNFLNLKERAIRTGECIVALVAKIKGEKVKTETSIKYRVRGLLGWRDSMLALDDKPHEWYGKDSLLEQKLNLDPNKRPVYMIKFSSSGR